MSWDHIRIFIEVAQAGSVVKAATRLGISHATALRNVSRLERDIGVKLFDRLQSGYRITPQGEEILPNALAMAEQAARLERQAAAKNPAPEGLLSLVVPESSLFDLMPLIAEFRTKYPLIYVDTESGGVESIAQAKADVVIALTNTPPDELVGRQLTKIEFAYYVSPTYLKLNTEDKPLRPSACAWITWNSSMTSDAEVDSDWQEIALRRFSKQPNVVLRTSGHNDAISATSSGVGVSLLKKPQIELVELTFKPAIQSVGVWMLTHQDLRRSGRIQGFMDFAVDHFLG